MSFLGTRNAVAIGVSQHLTLGGPDLLSKLSPSLILQFAGAQTMDPRITFTRSTTATFTGSNGLLQTAAINAPRFDYDPVTLAPLGLLIEEQRTNTIRNNTMQGAVAGTPGTLPTNWGVSGLGTLTQTVVGTGIENGVNYIDLRFNGTASTTQIGIRFEPANGIAGTNGQTFSFSTWIARVAGSTANVTEVLANTNIYNAASGYLTSNILTGYPSSVSTTLSRLSGAATITAATAAFIQPQIYLSITSGAAIDITLRIGLPQLELGAFATSVIPTVASQVTRAADVAVMTGTNFSDWYNQTEGTLFAEVVYNGQIVGSAAETNAIIIDDGTASNRFTIRTVRDLSAPQADVTVFSGAVNQLDSAGFVPVIVGTQYKRTLAYALNNAIPCVNGVLDGATDTSFAVPVGANRLALPTTLCALYIRKITYYPRRLSNAALQGITS